MTSSRPDLADLEVLVRIAERGSIGRAAAELRLSQPSISRRVAKLERTLGVALLQRSARGSSLTPAGRVIVDWSAALLAAAEEFTRSVDALREAAHHAVRAAVSMTVAEHYAPRWLAAARRATPETAVSLTLGNSTRVVELVMSGEADVGIVEAPSVPEALRHRQIAEDRVVVVVPTGHPWARRGAVPPQEVAATPVLVREAGSGTRETLERALAAAGHRLLVGLELASNTALRSAAMTGMGPAVVPEVAVAHELAVGQLVEVEVEGLPLRRPISVVWLEDHPSGARVLLDLVDQAASSADSPA